MDAQHLLSRRVGTTLNTPRTQLAWFQALTRPAKPEGIATDTVGSHFQSVRRSALQLRHFNLFPFTATAGFTIRVRRLLPTAKLATGQLIRGSQRSAQAALRRLPRFFRHARPHRVLAHVVDCRRSSRAARFARAQPESPLPLNSSCNHSTCATGLFPTGTSAFKNIGPRIRDSSNRLLKLSCL